MQPETKCHRCTKAKKIYKNKQQKCMVNCEVLGTRRCRANKGFCKPFHEKYDFILENVNKPYEQWRWVKKENVKCQN